MFVGGRDIGKHWTETTYLPETSLYSPPHSTVANQCVLEFAFSVNKSTWRTCKCFLFFTFAFDITPTRAIRFIPSSKRGSHHVSLRTWNFGISLLQWAEAKLEKSRRTETTLEGKEEERKKEKRLSNKERLIFMYAGCLWLKHPGRFCGATTFSFSLLHLRCCGSFTVSEPLSLNVAHWTQLMSTWSSEFSYSVYVNSSRLTGVSLPHAIAPHRHQGGAKVKLSRL